MPEARPAQKIKLTHVDTGEVVERWPVDAREMVGTGKWKTVDNIQLLMQKATGTGSGTYTPPEGEPDPLPHLTAAEAALEHDPNAILNAARENPPEEPPPDIPPEETEPAPPEPKKGRGKK